MKFEGRKKNVGMFLTAVIGIALALSMVNSLPFAVAQTPPPMVELRCGDNMGAGMGNVMLDDGITPVPVGCLVEVRNFANMAEVFSYFYMGDGSYGGSPPSYRAGQFDVWPYVPLGAQIVLRAYNAPTSASATLWGDSASRIISGSGTFDFAGWSLGNTQATSTSSSQQATGNITLQTNGLPMINSYDLRDASNNQSMLNMQLAVGRPYYFMVNVTDLSGINEISMVTIKAWHDMGVETTPYGAGVPNTEFAIQYNWNTTTYSLVSTYTNSSTQQEIRNIGGYIQETYDYDTNTTYHDTFVLIFLFTPGEQIRHAPGDGLFEAPPAVAFDDPARFNDINSWNFEISVENNNGFKAKALDEFGVYRYTAISAGDISAEGLPGQMVAFPERIITYSSNDRYNLGVYVNNTLNKTWPTTTPDATIPVEQIYVAGGWLVKTQFSGIGSANTQYFYQIRAAPDYGNYQEIPIYFWVDIPLNVLGGVYKGDVVYLIEQI